MISDQMTIRITGAEVWNSLRILNENGIEISHIQELDPLCVSVSISSRKYRSVKQILKKIGDSVKTERLSTWRAVVGRMQSRAFLLTGVVLLFIINIILPTRILSIQVEGNKTLSSRRIQDAAEHAGIGFFASRREVRSEKMKNQLLAMLPELEWAGVNTYGCKAVISVRERKNTSEYDELKHIVSNIIANRDGVVHSVTVNSGSVRCEAGQSVKKGQLLISGYTDCGICIRASRAKGEIFAQTIRKLQCVRPKDMCSRAKVKSIKKNISIIFGKKRFFLFRDSGIWDATCGRIIKQYTFSLPGGLSLPLSVCVEMIMSYSMESGIIDMKIAEQDLHDNAEIYLNSQMIAGKIQSAKELLQEKDGYFLLQGNYVCTEMIGRERMEKIGDLYGQDN